MFEVHLNEKNEVKLPDEVAKRFPNGSFQVIVEEDKVILMPLKKKKYFGQIATPQERVKVFLEWAYSHKDWADFPDQTWRREDIYIDDEEGG